MAIGETRPASGGSAIRLWSFLRSPNPLKVRLALAELGIEYETIEVNLFRGEHRKPEFGEVNPHRKVPVLEDDGERLAESNAILVYLARTRAQHGSLWPPSPADEARALRWMFFESAHLAMQAGTVWWNDVVAPEIGRPGAPEPVLAEAVEELSRSFDLLEEHLCQRAFMMGGFTLVDCSVGVPVAMMRTTRLDREERWPNVIAYRERLRARASWKAAQGDAIHDLG